MQQMSVRQFGLRKNTLSTYLQLNKSQFWILPDQADFNRSKWWWRSERERHIITLHFSRIHFTVVDLNLTEKKKKDLQTADR